VIAELGQAGRRDILHDQHPHRYPPRQQTANGIRRRLRGGIVGVTKVIEVIGSSTESSDDAVREALSAASRSIRGITRIEVTSVSCEVRDGHVARWDVLAKIQFPVEPR
jgi:flavin-binding protein dodecin